jgi:hypothetical protein
MESIQQIAEKFIQEILDVDILEGLTPSLQVMGELSQAFICRATEHKLQAADEAIFACRNLRRDWRVEHKGVAREQLTEHGQIQFRRRYYHNSKSGERKYLLDDLVGIETRDRVEAGLIAKLSSAAASHSYAKSSELCCDGQVTRQTVMNKTRQVKVCEQERPALREDVDVIHIQADEDHVAMQDGRRDSIVKLIAIHEPAQKVSSKRWQLPKRHLLTSYKENTGDLWLRVADEIARRYGDRDTLTIYIHGDGARWIRNGTQWLKNSHFVLDKFHVSQKLHRVIGDAEGFRQYIWDNLAKDKLQAIEHLTEALVNSEACAEQTGKDFVRYIRNNRDGIRIWYDEKHPVGGSCAEGLVSHVLSSRLSSRPCGWLDEGLETVSRLRVHVLNGGKITAENVRKPSKPVIHSTKTLKKAMRPGVFHRSMVMHSDRRHSPEYRLFKAITEGGHAI